MWTSTLELNPAHVIPTKILGRFWHGAYFSSFAPLQVQNLPRQTLPATNWVRVRNTLAGICGSDLQAIFLKGSFTIASAAVPGLRRSYPGHEVVGEVIEVGDDVTTLRVGDRVVLKNGANCVTAGIQPPCRSCAYGNYVLCEQANLPGPYPFGGGWSEEMLLHEQQLFRVPSNITDMQAVLLEPSAVALHAALRRVPVAGEHVLIIGAGTLGLLLLQIVRLLAPDAEVSMLARHAFQVEQAARLGAQIIYPQDSYREVQRITGAQLCQGPLGNKMLLGGYDIIFDTVGSSETTHDSLRWARAGSTIVMVGTHLYKMRIDLTPIWYQEINLIGATGQGMEYWPVGTDECVSTFDAAAELIEEKLLFPEKLITHSFALSDYRNALLAATHKEHNRAIKVIFDYSKQPPSVVPNVRAAARLRQRVVTPVPYSDPRPSQPLVPPTPPTPSNDPLLPPAPTPVAQFVSPIPSAPSTPPASPARQTPSVPLTRNPFGGSENGQTAQNGQGDQSSLSSLSSPSRQIGQAGQTDAQTADADWYDRTIGASADNFPRHFVTLQPVEFSKYSYPDHPSTALTPPDAEEETATTHSPTHVTRPAIEDIDTLTFSAPTPPNSPDGEKEDTATFGTPTPLASPAIEEQDTAPFFTPTPSHSFAIEEQDTVPFFTPTPLTPSEAEEETASASVSTPTPLTSVSDSAHVQEENANNRVEESFLSDSSIDAEHTHDSMETPLPLVQSMADEIDMPMSFMPFDEEYLDTQDSMPPWLAALNASKPLAVTPDDESSAIANADQQPFQLTPLDNDDTTHTVAVASPKSSRSKRKANAAKTKNTPTNKQSLASSPVSQEEALPAVEPHSTVTNGTVNTLQGVGDYTDQESDFPSIPNHDTNGDPDYEEHS